jgi:stalled ribosome rescue protein Dom34
MQIIKHNRKQGIMQVRIDSPDDLWDLSQVIEPGDILRGRTVRKVKAPTERATDSTRRPMTLTIKSEKSEWDPDSSTLRVTGIITDGPDDIPRGDHHSFSLSPGDSFSLQ